MTESSLYYFIALYTICSIICVGIMIWFRTANGKRWLAEL